MKTIQWGLLGSGKTTQRFMKGLALTDGRCVAVATRSKQDQWKHAYPNLTVYDDYQSLIEDPNVDAIYISLRHADHYQWAQQALLHHKAVLCEKPATLKASELSDLIKLSHDHKVFFLEALKTRFMPIRETLNQWIQESGPIQSITNGFGYCLDYDPKSYLYDLNQGGILYDVGSYTLGAILDCVSSDIKDVHVQAKLAYGVDAFTMVDLVFENGVKAHTEMALDRVIKTNMTIRCEKATITVENFHRPTRIFRESLNGKETLEMLDDDFKGEIEAVHQGIRTQRIESDAYTHADTLRVIQLMEHIHKEIHR